MGCCDKIVFGDMGSIDRGSSTHVGNVYFAPLYFTTFIENQLEGIDIAKRHAQLDYAEFDKDNSVVFSESMTPSNYLNNPYELNFFDY